MLGHAEEWFYRGLAGIDFDLTRDEDSRILIHPAIVGDVHSVTATFQSKLGKIESGWSRSGGTLHMNVSIPAGAKATILFPPGYDKAITINGHALKEEKTLRMIHSEHASGCVVEGGAYRFEMHR
jgi:hypothetical protein